MNEKIKSHCLGLILTSHRTKQLVRFKKVCHENGYLINLDNVLNNENKHAKIGIETLKINRESKIVGGIILVNIKYHGKLKP